MAMDARAALRLLAEFGADEALDDFPHDRFADAVRPAPTIPDSKASIAALKPIAPRPAHSASSQAASIAASCHTIEDLREKLANFSACPLKTTATNLVFSVGKLGAPRIVFVGDVPGPEEDVAGTPFVGQAGKLFDRMLASISLSRENCVLTNLIAWRPPGNRAPTDSETAMCLAFLTRHLTLLAPDMVITLGTLPTEALTGQSGGIRRLRGKWRELSLPGLERPVALLAMFHPGYALTMPIAKREIWADLISISQKLIALSPH